MPILKNYALPNGGTATFHVLKTAQYGQVDGVLTLSVQSFADEPAFLTGYPPMWNTPMAMPLAAVGAPFAASVESWLVLTADSPFVGGSIVTMAGNSLESAKLHQWAAIKALRDAKKSGGFKFGLRWFHSDEPSRAQYGILLTTALEKSLPTVYVLNATWKDMSGTKAPLTVADLRGIRDAGLLLEAQLFAVAEAHRAAMEASATPSDYDFSTGWPATFKDAT